MEIQNIIEHELIEAGEDDIANEILITELIAISNT